MSLFVALLFSGSSVKGQSGCCVAVNFNDFQSYCIANMNPCNVGTTCTGVALNAAYGISGDWINFQCNVPADCSAQGCGALPVEMIDYDVSYADDGIEVYWTTATETDNVGFEVERSIDGKDWKILEFVEGQGTSLEQNSYSYFDESPVIGFNYYRVKQIDYNGNYEYTSIKVTIWQGGTDLDKLQLAVLPNPASEWLTVALPKQLNRNSDLRFDIYDQAGRLVKRAIVNPNSSIEVSLDELTQGYYILNVSQGQIQYSSRFIKK